MLTHYEPIDKKYVAQTGFKLLGLYVGVGGLTVNIWMQFASQETQDTYTCENAQLQFNDTSALTRFLNAFYRDYGNRMFNFGGLCALLIPTSYFAATQLSLCLKNKPLLKDEIVDMIVNAAKTSFNVGSTAVSIAQLHWPNAAKYPFIIFSGTPLIRPALRFFDINYPARPSWPALHRAMPNNAMMAKIAASLEAISTIAGLASAVDGFIAMMADLFFDAEHKNDWPYTDLTLNISIGVCIFAGALSILHEQGYYYTTAASMLLRTFRLIDMPLLSILFCLDQDLENYKTFDNLAIYLVGLISLFSAFIAGLSVNYTMPANDNDPNNNPEPAIPEIHEDENEQAAGEIRPLISPIDQEHPSINTAPRENARHQIIQVSPIFNLFSSSNSSQSESDSEEADYSEETDFDDRITFGATT